MVGGVTFFRIGIGVQENDHHSCLLAGKLVGSFEDLFCSSRNAFAFRGVQQGRVELSACSNN